MRPKRLTCPDCGYTTTIATRRSTIACRGCGGEIPVHGSAAAKESPAAKPVSTDDVHELDDAEVEVLDEPVELEVVESGGNSAEGNRPGASSIDDRVDGEAEIASIDFEADEDDEPGTRSRERKSPSARSRARTAAKRFVDDADEPISRPRAPRDRRPVRSSHDDDFDRFEDHRSSSNMPLIITGLVIGMFLLAGVAGFATWHILKNDDEPAVVEQPVDNDFAPAPNANMPVAQAAPNEPNQFQPQPVQPVQPQQPAQPNQPQQPNVEPAPAPAPNPNPEQPFAPAPQPLQPNAGANPNQFAPAPPAKINPEDVPRLKYTWQPGRTYKYKFKVRGEFSGVVQNVGGSSRYTVLPPGNAVELEQFTATGTGFVVTSNGYMVTCHHVIEDAVKIDVQLDGKNYVGKVIGQNVARDLALVKIEAANLPTVSLGDSDNVQLAQEIRAIGYPLTDVLGKNVKVTKGSVSGLNERNGGRVFQIDAAINPGNSGGPVVTNKGGVIGVASSKLTGVSVSKVGFAMPSKDVKKLLDKHGVKYSTKVSDHVLDGPGVAQRIVPSIALLTVEVKPNAGDQIRVRYSTSFTSSNQQRGLGIGGMRDPFFMIPQAKSDNGEFVMDQFGSLLEGDFDAHLPYLLGPAAMMPIEMLDELGRDEWDIREPITITRVEQPENNDPFARFGPRRSPFSRIPRSPFSRMPIDPFNRGGAQPKAKVETFRGMQETSYDMRQLHGKTIEIAKTISLDSKNQQNTPYAKLDGQGTLRFDSANGLPLGLEFNGKMVRTHDGDKVEVKITLSYELEN